MKNILTADIGATNSRFAHFEVDQNGKLSLVGTKWLKTQESASFGSLVQQLYGSGFSLGTEGADIAIIAVACPVEGGVYCSPPYISWDIELSAAQKAFGLKRCLLINDFVAQAFACRSPIAEEAEQILPGQMISDATVAVIGAGSNLGKAALVPDGSGGFVAMPSEGGHANFPFVSEREFEFQEFLLGELGEEYVTANTVVSGRGLSFIHRFLTGERLEPRDVTAKLSPNSETIAWAARLCGRVCRNYALETLALGGLYVSGGVAAKVPHLVTHEAFASEFHSSRTLSELLKKIPVYLNKNEESGLWGAAFLGLQEFQRESGQQPVKVQRKRK
ncbi:MAG: glucokinase [Proteobacteria bacterium]|nr:glucokinase [Pseudomonadota bacterium]